MVERLFTVGQEWAGYSIEEALIRDESPLEYYRAAKGTLLVCLNARGAAISAGRAAQFLSTLKVWKSVTDPRIGRILDGGFDDGVFWAVAEDFRGASLRAFFCCHSEGQSTPLPHALVLIRGCAQALEIANTQGVLHLGLTPTTIFISPSFQVERITPGFDGLFGTEPQLDQDVVYRAPELIRREARDQRADIFALGSIFYELLVAQPPFLGAGTEVPSCAKLATLTLTEMPPPIRLLRKGLPDKIDSFVARAIARSPNDRFPSWGQLIAEIDRIGSRFPSWKAALDGRDVPPFLTKQAADAAKYTDDLRSNYVAADVKSGVRIATESENEKLAPTSNEYRTSEDLPGPATEREPTTLPAGTAPLKGVDAHGGVDRAVNAVEDPLGAALARLGAALQKHGQPEVFGVAADAVRRLENEGARDLPLGSPSASSPPSVNEVPSEDVPICYQSDAPAPASEPRKAALDLTTVQLLARGPTKPAHRWRAKIALVCAALSVAALVSLAFTHRSAPSAVARSWQLPILIPLQQPEVPSEMAPVPTPAHEAQTTRRTNVQQQRRTMTAAVAGARPRSSTPERSSEPTSASGLPPSQALFNGLYAYPEGR